MAANIVASKDRRWIAKTYKQSEVSDALQEWVNLNQQITGRDEISSGLFACMGWFEPKELAKLSKHLSGQAFDVKPTDGLTGTLMLSALTKLAKKYSGKFIEREGGLVRWHFQT